MADALRRAKRIQRALRDLEQIETSRLTAIDRQIAECDDDKARLLKVFADQSALQGHFTDLLSKRLANLVKAGERLVVERRDAEHKVRDAKTRTKGADGILDEALEQVSRRDEARHLEAVIEALSALNRKPEASR